MNAPNPTPATSSRPWQREPLVWLVIALMLLWSGIRALARLPQFAIKGIVVEGDVARNSVANIRLGAMSRLSGNFFTMDLRSAKEAFEQVPWVRKAVVRREWPGKLRVTFQEHEVAAFWGDEALLNIQGEVFEANPGDVEGDRLPILEGPDGTGPQVLALYRKLNALFVPLRVGVTHLTLTERGSWRAELDSGAPIELGRGDEEQVLARTEQFIRTVTQVTARFKRPVEYADLRHVDGYVIKLKGVSTLQPASAPRKP